MTKKAKAPTLQEKLAVYTLTPHYYFARPEEYYKGKKLIVDKRKLTVCLLSRQTPVGRHQVVARGVTMCSLQEPKGFKKPTGRTKALGLAISAAECRGNKHGFLPPQITCQGLEVASTIGIAKAQYDPTLTDKERAIMASWKRHLEKMQEEMVQEEVK